MKWTFLKKAKVEIDSPGTLGIHFVKPGDNCLGSETPGGRGIPLPIVPGANALPNSNGGVQIALALRERREARKYKLFGLEREREIHVVGGHFHALRGGSSAFEWDLGPEVPGWRPLLGGPCPVSVVFYRWCHLFVPTIISRAHRTLHFFKRSYILYISTINISISNQGL